LWPGMSGGKLGLFDAYVPAAEAASGDSSGGSQLAWITDRYQDALDQARREHKLVFIDFTGYACANCHWMRANVLSRPEFQAVLKNFVLLELNTDNGSALDDANLKLETDKFGSLATPFYGVVDADGRVVDRWDGRATNADERAKFLAWMQSASQKTSAPTSAGLDLPGLTTLDAAPFNTAALNGKVVVVNFWATWCVPCIGELPTFNQVHHDLASKGVAIIGIDALDDDNPDTPEKIRHFLTKHPIDYPIALGNKALEAKFKLESRPLTIIFDRSGREVKRFDESLTAQDLAGAIQKVL